MSNTDRYIVGTNSSGKTRKMLEEASESGAIVVCKNPYSMANKANAYGIFNLEFVSYEDFLETNFYNEKIAIDELGDFMSACFDVDFDAFTMTVD